MRSDGRTPCPPRASACSRGVTPQPSPARADREARPLLPLLVASLCLIAAAAPAFAYVGPGGGITMLGALWGVLVPVALAVGAVLFYPVRVLVRRFRRPAPAGTPLARDDAARRAAAPSRRTASRTESRP